MFNEAVMSHILYLQPHPSTDAKAKDCIFHLTRKVFCDLLTGTGLKLVKTRVKANLRNQFSDDNIGHE